MKKTITSKENMPFEKSRKFGIQSLTDSELLAVLLRTGSRNQNVLEVADKILSVSEENPGLIGLYYLTEHQLCEIDGIGKVKAHQLLCLAELAKRFSKEEKRKGLSFGQPKTVAEYYMQESRFKTQEVLKLVMLNSKSCLIKDMELTQGTVNYSVADPRDIFIQALKYGAVSIILLHNHPSGDPTPSREDLSLTERIFDAGRLIGVELLDHIILGDNCYYSFREMGRL